jgi:hypothetical protein
MSTNDQIQSLQAPEDDKNVVTWLTGHAKEHPFLLAFADDGVVWGKSENEKWTTSYDVFGKPFSELRGETLQEVFAFSEKDQVHL